MPILAGGIAELRVDDSRSDIGRRIRRLRRRKLMHNARELSLAVNARRTKTELILTSNFDRAKVRTNRSRQRGTRRRGRATGDRRARRERKPRIRTV